MYVPLIYAQRKILGHMRRDLGTQPNRLSEGEIEPCELRYDEKWIRRDLHLLADLALGVYHSGVELDGPRPYLRLTPSVHACWKRVKRRYWPNAPLSRRRGGRAFLLVCAIISSLPRFAQSFEFRNKGVRPRNHQHLWQSNY